MPWFFCYDTGLDVSTVPVNPIQCRGFPGLSFPRGWVGKEQLDILDRALGEFALGAQFRHWVVSLPVKPKGVRTRTSGLSLSCLFALLWPNEERKVVVLGRLHNDFTLHSREGDLGRLLQAYEQGYRYFVVPQSLDLPRELLKGIRVLPCARVSERLLHFTSLAVESVKQCSFVPPSEIPENVLAQKALLWSAVGSLHTLFGVSEQQEVDLLCQGVGFLRSKAEGLGWQRYRASLTDLSGNGEQSFCSRLLKGACSPTRLLGYREPGEVNWADRGILETPVIQDLSPVLLSDLVVALGEGKTRIRRGMVNWQWRARAQWVAGTTYCPCEGLGGRRHCVCPHSRLYAFRNRLTPKIADFFELIVPVGSVEDTGKQVFSTWEEAVALVVEARKQQVCVPRWIRQAGRECSRGQHKIKLAIVLAQLEHKDQVTQEHWIQADRIARWHPWEVAVNF